MKYIAAMVVLYALYFVLCWFGTGTEKKSMKSFYSYPDGVQDAVRRDEHLRALIPPEKSRGKVFWSNLVLFTAVFILTGLILHIRSFGTAFLYILLLGEGLNLFDLLVIDMCWWRHSKRVRFDGIGTDRDYMDMSKHEGSFLRGIPVFALAALFAAGILQI